MIELWKGCTIVHPSPPALQTLETAMNDEGAYVPGVVNTHRGAGCDAERQPSHTTLNNFTQKGLGAYFHYLKQSACILGNRCIERREKEPTLYKVMWLKYSCDRLSTFGIRDELYSSSEHIN